MNDLIKFFSNKGLFFSDKELDEIEDIVLGQFNVSLFRRLGVLEAGVNTLLASKDEQIMPTMSVKDACAALGLSRSTFDRMEGVTKVKRGGKWYVSRKWVENFHTIHM